MRSEYTAGIRPRDAGFTLVELLVVIAVISILASMLMPALGKAMDNARSISCLSNLKQTASTMFLYSGDFRGWAVVRNNSSTEVWPNVLMKNSYLPADNVMSCPSQPATSNVNSFYRDNHWITYAMHATGHSNWLVIDGESIVQNLNRLKPNAQFFFDGLRTHNDIPMQIYLSYYVNTADLTTSRFHTRHSRLGNVAMLDGHAKAMSQNEYCQTYNDYMREPFGYSRVKTYYYDSGKNLIYSDP